MGFNGYQPRETIELNRRRLVETVAGSGFSLAVLRQVHSDVIHCLKQVCTGLTTPEGDGWITDQPEVLLGVQVADCMPVLIADPVKRVVTAVHAGWRGTLKRILEKAVLRMSAEFLTQPEDCLAVVGPSIRVCCYEVGEEVVDAFRSEFQTTEDMFRLGPNALRELESEIGSPAVVAPTWHLDLHAAARMQLQRAGLASNKIFADSACTACNTDRFFSHRAEQGNTGRMMAVIGIRN